MSEQTRVIGWVKDGDTDGDEKMVLRKRWLSVNKESWFLECCRRLVGDKLEAI